MIMILGLELGGYLFQFIQIYDIFKTFHINKNNSQLIFRET